MEKKAQKYNPFMFENEFSNTPAPPPEAEPAPLTQEDIAQAQAQGYAKGLEEGKTQALEDFRQELNTHTAKLDQALNTIKTVEEKAHNYATERALELLKKISACLLSHAQQHYPEELLKSILAVKIPQSVNKTSATLSIMVHSQTETYVKENIVPKLKSQNIEIIPDNSLPLGDCRLCWPEGGIELQHNTLLENIHTILEQGSHNITPPQEVTNTKAPETPEPEALEHKSQEAHPPAKENTTENL